MEKKKSKFDKLKNQQNSQNFKKKSQNQQGNIEEINKQDIEFEDDWEDEYEEEIIVDDKNQEVQQISEKVKYQPFVGTKKDLQEDEKLEYFNEAYQMFHQASTEWPCLSIDVIANWENLQFQLKDFKTPIPFKYPIDVYLIGGSQSDQKNQNFFYLMKFSDLSITKYDDDEDIEDSFEETNPSLIHCKFPLKAATNRVKSMNHFPIAALMNDNAQLQILDLRQGYENLQKKNSSNIQMQTKIINQFLLQDEGFALQFSNMIPGLLISGSNNGELNVFQPDQNFSNFQKIQSLQISNKSLEDIQFSTSDPNAFAVSSSDSLIRIFDLRNLNQNQNLEIHGHTCDVNVLSWNEKSSNLLASGDDNGEFKIWDLRYLGKDPITSIQWHQEPITSIQWQPHDEWTLAVASADNTISFWDFSVEKDETDMELENNYPEQLLFLHQGQEDLKDVCWHPQYKNVVLSTALDGYNIFEPESQ